MLADQSVQLPLDNVAANSVAHAYVIDVGDEGARIDIAGEIIGEQADAFQQRDGGIYFERVQQRAPCYARQVANMTTVIALATHRKARSGMLEHSWATISTAEGVVAPLTGGADFRGKPGRRQVTVLTAEGWAQACQQLGYQLPWTTRRANLLLDGITIDGGWATAAHLRVGEAVLLITGECPPCHRMDERANGLRAALTADWRGGVTCRVVRDGLVRVGDAAMLEPAPTTATVPISPCS